MFATDKLKIAVLVSGRGSNLQSIVDACRSGEINADTVLVLSDNSKAKALERARNQSIKSKVLQRKNYDDVATYDVALSDAVEESGADLVCLAGFMRILSKKFIHRFDGNIINVHPSLLPSFPGLAAQRQALDHGVKVSGCTVHFVDEGVDTGPIIIQSCVPVMPRDTVESLSARILEQEHIIYPKAIQMIASGEVKRWPG
jgi:phosphoribosylglycinamide formyltransferase-1